jgi:uncharacterized membrane protein
MLVAVGMATETVEINTLVLSLAYALHMLATVVWIGGLIFQAAFLIPALRNLNTPSTSTELLERLRTRFQPVAWLSLAVLIGSGLLQMSANPNYEGLFKVSNLWSQAIFVKHISFGFMILLAAYQSFILYPRLTRALLHQKSSNATRLLHSGADLEARVVRVNVLLSLLVLLLTAFARTA